MANRQNITQYGFPFAKADGRENNAERMMKVDQRERQQKEIATIKDRTLIIKLSDADVLRVCKRAGAHNITVAEMVESYLQDLVGGTYTNGSDERDMANAYFERCWVGMFPENTFVRYLIEWDYMEHYIELEETIKELKGYITRLYAEDKEELEALQEDVKELKGYAENYYKEYCESCKNEEHEPFEKANEAVVKWHEEYKKLKGETEE